MREASDRKTSGADPKSWFAPFLPATAESEAALFAAIRRQFGGETAAALRRAMERRRAGTDAAFYAALPPAVRTALALAYDGESLLAMAGFLAAHRELLAGRVLDFGCGCGLLTLAVGRMARPRALWGADRDPGALAAARTVCGRGGAAAQFAREAPAEDFDAVISARTLHENFDQSGVPYLETLPEAGRRLADRMTGHARALTARVAAEGALLSVERGGTGPVLLGWLLALADCGFAPVDYAPLAVRECGRPASFQALVLRRGAADAETALVYFCRLAAPAEPAGSLTGMAAAAYLHLWSGACAYRFAVCSPDGAPMGRGGVWRHKTDGRVLAFQATPAGTALQVLPPEALSAAEQQLRASARQAEAAGYCVQVLSPLCGT
ncbi:MAG: methyltransferase [Oscillospiraceae bacterium]|nr:methyltransferase [Oscillospiraceae bacterium]